MISPFQYPTTPHIRRHGPCGYADYESYRDWLRDEFLFRCVYCLHREKWYDRGATFHIDHQIPVAEDPTKLCEYTNLLYACASCNESKKAVLGLADPCSIAFSECLRVESDGHVVALNNMGEKLRRTLLLDSPRNVQYRSRLLRTLAHLEVAEPNLFNEWLGFPTILPDLRTKRAPMNTKPSGAANCYFALRERNELPCTY